MKGYDAHDIVWQQCHGCINRINRQTDGNAEKGIQWWIYKHSTAQHRERLRSCYSTEQQASRLSTIQLNNHFWYSHFRQVPIDWHLCNQTCSTLQMPFQLSAGITCEKCCLHQIVHLCHRTWDECRCMQFNIVASKHYEAPSPRQRTASQWKHFKRFEMAA